MKVCVIHDGTGFDLHAFVADGKTLNNEIITIDPSDFEDKKKALDDCEVMIFISITKFHYAQIRTFLTQAYEKCCPYYTLEINDDKKKHALIGMTFFKRSNGTIFFKEETRESFMKWKVFGVKCDDNFDAWKLITERHGD